MGQFMAQNAVEEGLRGQVAEQAFWRVCEVVCIVLDWKELNQVFVAMVETQAVARYRLCDLDRDRAWDRQIAAR